MSTTPSSTTTSIVGIFDSWFGGLTVLRALIARPLRGSKPFLGFRCASLRAIFGSSLRDERAAPSGKSGESIRLD